MLGDLFYSSSLKLAKAFVNPVAEKILCLIGEAIRFISIHCTFKVDYHLEYEIDCSYDKWQQAHKPF